LNKYVQYYDRNTGAHNAKGSPNNDNDGRLRDTRTVHVFTDKFQRLVLPPVSRSSEEEVRWASFEIYRAPCWLLEQCCCCWSRFPTYRLCSRCCCNSVRRRGGPWRSSLLN